MRPEVICKIDSVKYTNISQEACLLGVRCSEPGKKPFTLPFFLRYRLRNSTKDGNFPENILLYDFVCI